MSMYSEKFWQKNWDEGLEDLDPKEYETTFVQMIKEKVAPYEAPKIIEIIEAMPLTAVGKIDKKVLRVK